MRGWKYQGQEIIHIAHAKECLVNAHTISWILLLAWQLTLFTSFKASAGSELYTNTYMLALHLHGLSHAQAHMLHTRTLNTRTLHPHSYITPLTHHANTTRASSTSILALVHPNKVAGCNCCCIPMPGDLSVGAVGTTSL